MVPFWPELAKTQSMTKALNEFARAFDSKKKIVFSRSLTRTEDKNTRIVRTDPQDEILKLKQEQGKDILLGGVSIPSQLIERGLVDEYRFVCHFANHRGRRQTFVGSCQPAVETC